MISVIVPVYNVEKYIHTCINSILNQSYKDFELILVDDGSSDSCPIICNQYAKDYNNVVVIHKRNGGLSDARNIGTEIAKGEYITYIDSDDYIDKTYLEVLWGLINKYKADIAVTGIRKFYEEENITLFNHSIKEYCFSGMEALEHMLYQNMLDSSACAMLLPIKIAKKYPFPYGKYHEDEFTTYKYYASASRVAITTKPQYFYLQRKHSIMHTFGQANLDELEAADNLVNVCSTDYPNILNAALSKKFSDYCQVLLSVKNLKQVNPEIYNRIIYFLNAIKKKIIIDSKARKKNRVAALLLFIDPKVLILINQFIKNKM